jgi:hypothetical protein
MSDLAPALVAARSNLERQGGGEERYDGRGDKGSTNNYAAQEPFK